MTLLLIQLAKHTATRRNALTRGLALLLFMIALTAAPVRAQQTWDYSPYDLRVWVAVKPSPRLSGDVLDRLQRSMRRDAELLARATWDLKPKAAPATVHSDIVEAIDDVTADQVLKGEKEIRLADKVYLLGITDNWSSFRVQVRELDMHTRAWSDTFTYDVRHPERLESQAFEAVRRAFSPVVRIEEVDSRDVRGRVRASGLIYGPNSPVMINRGDALQPVVRRNGRDGEPLNNGINVVPWAIGQVVEVVRTRGEIRQAEEVATMESLLINLTIGDAENAPRLLQAGEKLIIGGVDGARRVIKPVEVEVLPITKMENLIEAMNDAMVDVKVQLVRGVISATMGTNGPLNSGFTMSVTVNRGGDTPVEPFGPFLGSGNVLDIRLHSGRSNPLGSRTGVRTKRYAWLIRPKYERTQLLLESNEDSPRALAGYDLYSKDPINDKVTFMGKSDWRGAFEVTPGDRKFHVIYVRNGGQLMARLPVVPGFIPTMSAQMRNDEARLQAESFIKAVEGEVMDQVVQRKLLASYVSKNIAAGKLDDAQKFLAQYQELPKRNDVVAELDNREGKIIGGDVLTRRKVSRMFGEMKELINQHLDPNLFISLQEQLRSARAKAGG